MSKKTFSMVSIALVAFVVAIVYFKYSKIAEINSATESNQKPAHTGPPLQFGSKAESNRLAAKTIPPSASNLNVDSVPPSFEAAISKLPLVDQVYLKKLNTQFYGMLNYTSREELQWKSDRVFPSIEEALALRNQPAPRFLNHDELKMLTPKEAAQYLFHNAITLDPTPDLSLPEPSRYTNEFLYIISPRSYILDKLDTPLIAFINASRIAPDDKEAPKWFLEAATMASLYGDATLGIEIATRFNQINQSISVPVSNVAYAEVRKARSQVSYCGVDRYTGNPRTVETIRRLRLTNPCK